MERIRAFFGDGRRRIATGTVLTVLLWIVTYYSANCRYAGHGIDFACERKE